MPITAQQRLGAASSAGAALGRKHGGQEVAADACADSSKFRYYLTHGHVLGQAQSCRGGKPAEHLRCGSSSSGWAWADNPSTDRYPAGKSPLLKGKSAFTLIPTGTITCQTTRYRIAPTSDTVYRSAGTMPVRRQATASSWYQGYCLPLCSGRCLHALHGLYCGKAVGSRSLGVRYGATAAMAGTREVVDR